MAGNRIPVSESEYKIIRLAVEKGLREATLEDASRILGVPRSTLESILRLLQEKGIVEIIEETKEKPVLTNRGIEALREGLPEERLVKELASSGGALGLEEVRERLGGTAGIAIGIAKRSGLVSISSGRVVLAVPLGEAKRRIGETREILELVEKGEAESVPRELLQRGLVRMERARTVRFRFRDDPRAVLDRVIVEVSRLTHGMIKRGEWRRVRLRRYDLTALPPRVTPARIHYLTEFIEMLRDIMVEMGFREVRGPLVELELFNFDILFQPQDHPAREIHDTLRPRRIIVGPEGLEHLLNRVIEVHRRGWGYTPNPQVSLRAVLRSQTTAVSARVLVERPKPPLRVFTIGRVFRSDVVDATHLPEFHQLEGLDGDNGYTFRDLLGILQEISERLGLQVRFKPAYFPFTEPSVEGYVRLPNGKWLELFGAGMLRPEVLEMAGIDYPVGAWGFGVERLAAAFYGLPDIRLLYTRSVRRVQESKVKLL